MSSARISRLSHRWLALAVGIQLAIWAASGVYMTAVDLDFIHGDPLVRNLRTAVPVDRVTITPAAVLTAYPDATGVALRALPDGAPVYEVLRPSRAVLLDATSGRVRSPLDADGAAALARAYYAGSGRLARVSLLERDPPIELQSRPLPLWRADFDDWLATTLYIDPYTGRLVTRRHRFWRWFDFLWSLHIMDYRERSDVNNWLLRIATVGAVALAASGVWLVAYAFRWRRPRRFPTP